MRNCTLNFKSKLTRFEDIQSTTTDTILHNKNIKQQSLILIPDHQKHFLVVPY